MKSIRLIICAVIILMSCGTVPEIHYYMIDGTTETYLLENAKYQKTLGVEKFRPEPLYESDRIVYRESKYEVKFYNYHRWVASPDQIVTEKVIEKFATSELFRQVVPFPHMCTVDYLLTGTIKAFEEIDEDDGWYGFVQLKFEMIDMSDNSLVWQDVIAKKTKARKKKPVELVKAIDVSLKECIEEAFTLIDSKMAVKLSD